MKPFMPNTKILRESMTKTGKQMSKNWIGQALCHIDSPWSDRTMSKDSIRVLLKKSFSVQ